MRAVEYIEKAEGIHSREKGAEARINQLSQSIDRLSSQKRELQEEIRQFLHEDDDSEYDLSELKEELANIEKELAETQGQKELAQQELYDAVEEREETLFEIQKAARVHARDLSGASNLFGSFAQIGSNLSKAFQGALGSLSQAASILGGSIDSHGGTGSVGRGSRSGFTPGISGGAADEGNPYASRQISGAHTLSGRFSSPTVNALSTFSSSQSSSQGISVQSARSSSGKSETSPISIQNTNLKQVRPSFYDNDIEWKMVTLLGEFPHMKSSEVQKIVRSQKRLVNIKRGTTLKPTKGLSSSTFSRLIKTQAKGYVQEEMIRHVLQDYFDSVAVTTKKSGINRTVTDIIAKGAKGDIRIGNCVIRKGENLSIESKAGEANYLAREVRKGHIAEQLAGMPRDSHRILLVTADYGNLSEASKAILNQILSDNQATMVTVPYYACDLTNAIMHTRFMHYATKSKSSVKHRKISRVSSTKNSKMVNKQHRVGIGYKSTGVRPSGWLSNTTPNNQQRGNPAPNAGNTTKGKGGNTK